MPRENLTHLSDWNCIQRALFLFAVLSERLPRRQTAVVERPREEGPPMERDRRAVQTHHGSKLHPGIRLIRLCLATKFDALKEKNTGGLCVIS